MNAQLTTVALLLTLSPGLRAAPALQDASEAPSPPAAGGWDGRLAPGVEGAESIFGAPLIVNGRRVPDVDIERFLCYGKGRNALESRRLEVLMQQERELRRFKTRERLAGEHYAAEDGTPLTWEDLTAEQRAEVDQAVDEELAYMKVPPGAVEARIAEHAADFDERYPTLDRDVETRRAYQSVAWYHDQVRQTMEFDAMFFPGHPDDWPEISREAVQAGAPNVDLLADYAQHYQWRVEEAQETGEPVKPDEEMMMTLLRDYVMAALASLVEIRTMTDGLPPELLMTIEGGGFRAELRTEDVYGEMQHVFTQQDVDDAKRWLALYYTAVDELRGLNSLIPREEWLETVANMREQMAGALFNFDFLALQGHQYPSLETYIEHLWLLESFKRHIEPEVARTENGALPPELQAFLETANVIMGLGRCRAEVLLVSAFDFPNYRWKEDGWKQAEERAFELRQQIDAHIEALETANVERRQAVEEGRNYEPDEVLLPFEQYWSNLLDLNSEYWDPPMPMTGKMPPALGLKNRGRFQGEPMTRNDFKRAIGESSYGHFLYDTALCDVVFFELEPGMVGGPYKGPEGYYVFWLRERLNPSKPIDAFNERHYAMLVEDYVRRRYTTWNHELARDREHVSGMPAW